MNEYPHVAIIGNINIEKIEQLKERLNNQINLYFYETDHNIKKKYIIDKINILITVGKKDWSEFKEIIQLSYHYRSKWLHFEDCNDIQLDSISHCHLNNNKSNSMPLISVCTIIYISDDKSNVELYDKIMRSFCSLQEQTYNNWEWMIFPINVASKENSIYEFLIKLEQEDPRIKIYHSIENLHIFKLSHGEIFTELNYGDELTTNCLDMIVKAFKKYPDVDFIYTDFSQIFETTDIPFIYYEGYCFGFSGYYKQRYKNKILNVTRSVNINPKTIRNIIGIPNHIQAWKSSFYGNIDGINNLISDIDNYELLVRTFLKGRMLKIPQLGYLKYQDQYNINNINNNINEIIKFEEKIIKNYDQQIIERFKEFNIDDNLKNIPCKNIWSAHHLEIEQYYNYIYRSDMISIVIPTYKRRAALNRTITSILNQTYQNFEILIVGDKCPELDSAMLEYNDHRIKWWNLAANSNNSGATPRNYALKMMASGKYIAYVDDDDYWTNDHLELLIGLFKSDPNLSYAFSSFQMNQYPIIATEPKLYRITTSALMHKYELLEKYGYWSPYLYTHDWDLVSRWKDHGEKYAATKKVTVIYEVNPKHVNAYGIYSVYGDQKPLINNNNNNNVKQELNDNNNNNNSSNIKQESSNDKLLFAITTLTYNNRMTLIKTIEYLKKELLKTKLDITWYILLQHCTNEYIATIKEITKDFPSNIKINSLIYEENLGLSSANNILIEKAKDYQYVLHLEDDWILLPDYLQPYKINDKYNGKYESWLDMCIGYMELHPKISTIFMRAYNNDKEKMAIWMDKNDPICMP